MQIIQSKSNLIEKIFRDKEGRLIRARFFVYENAGRIKARLLDFVYINEIAGKVFSLLGFSNSQYSIFNIPYSANGIVSPYFVSEILYSSGSKPRAPTFV